MPLAQNASITTWGQAKSRVARVAGQGDHADWKLAAGEAIRNALNRLELKRNWAWLYTVETIVVSSANDEYDVNNALRKVYTAVLGDRRLHYIHQRYQDMMNPENTGDGPYLYNVYNLPTNGKITLLPGTTGLVGNHNLTLRYLRAITIPANALLSTADDASLLDIPAQYEPVIMSWAKAELLADTGANDARMMFHENRGNSMYLDAVRDEVDIPDAVDTFVPAYDETVGWNPNSLEVLMQDD